MVTTADTAVLQTNGKTVWKVQTGDGSLNPLGNYKDHSPFQGTESQSDDLSQPDSPSMSPKGTDTVKGSRKRKMNSRPVRMVNVDVEADTDQSNTTDPLRSLLLQPIENQLQAAHSNKVRKTDDSVARNTQNTFNGKVIAPLGVIEIKPDDCSDEENGQNGLQAYESQVTSQTHSGNQDTGKKSGDKVGKVISTLSGNVNTSSVVNRICTEHAKKVVEGISTNISQVVKSAADSINPKCDCDCAGLNAKVIAIEKKLESLHDILNKIYAATCSGDTKDNKE